MSDELKPCPFCGKTATQESFFSDDGFPIGCSCIWDTHSGEEVIARWQTRPREDALTDENRKLKERIAELEEANRWIPVEERLPVPDVKQYYSDRLMILAECGDPAFACYVPKEFHADGFTYLIGWYLPGQGSPTTIKVTHWRPLPEKE